MVQFASFGSRRRSFDKLSRLYLYSFFLNRKHIQLVISSFCLKGYFAKGGCNMHIINHRIYFSICISYVRQTLYESKGCVLLNRQCMSLNRHNLRWTGCKYIIGSTLDTPLWVRSSYFKHSSLWNCLMYS